MEHIPIRTTLFHVGDTDARANLLHEETMHFVGKECIIDFLENRERVVETFRLYKLKNLMYLITCS